MSFAALVWHVLWHHSNVGGDSEKYVLLKLVHFPLQPNEYINTIFVPKGCQIPVDIDCLAAQGIFHMVCSHFTIFSMCYSGHRRSLISVESLLK